ncbi:hypothetical protein QJS04_geneDACA024845 [Acorus gramineus]|uniref:Uncharacterized protein n=1 Tax=Acorus gramineus TaxID=55184 RepID=A0AAV9A3L3_ACOGR|nr:hypothetical protein QJS04_geneDACA024845 [Acorus gramineus]
MRGVSYKLSEWLETNHQYNSSILKQFSFEENMGGNSMDNRVTRRCDQPHSHPYSRRKTLRTFGETIPLVKETRNYWSTQHYWITNLTLTPGGRLLGLLGRDHTVGRRDSELLVYTILLDHLHRDNCPTMSLNIDTQPDSTTMGTDEQRMGHAAMCLHLILTLTL